MQKKLLILLALCVLPSAAPAQDPEFKLPEDIVFKQLLEASKTTVSPAFKIVFSVEEQSERQKIKDYLASYRSRFTSMDSKGIESKLTDQQFAEFSETFADNTIPMNRVCRQLNPRAPLAAIGIPKDGIALLTDPTAYYDNPIFRNANNVLGEVVWFLPRIAGGVVLAVISGHSVRLLPSDVIEPARPINVAPGQGYAVINTTEKHWNDSCILWGAICKPGMAPRQKWYTNRSL